MSQERESGEMIYHLGTIPTRRNKGETETEREREDGRMERRKEGKKSRMMMMEEKESGRKFSEISQMPSVEEGRGGAGEEDDEEEAVAVAVCKKKSSIQVFEWVLETLMKNNTRTLHLLYVIDPLRFIQTGLGPLPFDQANEISQRQARHLQSLKIEKVTQVYKKMCKKKELELCVHCVESDSIQKALLDQVLKLRIKKLVLGSSSGLKMKWLKKSSISVFLAQHVPNFCAVMVIRNGRLVSFKDASDSFSSNASESSSTIMYSKWKSKGDSTSGSESCSSSGHGQMKYKASFGSSTFTSRSGGYITDDYLESFQSDGASCSRTLSLGKVDEENFMSQAFQNLHIESRSSFPIDSSHGAILDTRETLKAPVQQSHPETTVLETIDMAMHGGSEIISIEQSGRREDLYAVTEEQAESIQFESVHEVTDKLASHYEMVVALSNARQEIHSLQQELAMAKQQATENWRMYLEVMNKLEESDKET